MGPLKNSMSPSGKSWCQKHTQGVCLHNRHRLDWSTPCLLCQFSKHGNMLQNASRLVAMDITTHDEIWMSLCIVRFDGSQSKTPSRNTKATGLHWTFWWDCQTSNTGSTPDTYLLWPPSSIPAPDSWRAVETVCSVLLETTPRIMPAWPQKVWERLEKKHREISWNWSPWSSFSARLWKKCGCIVFLSYSCSIFFPSWNVNWQCFKTKWWARGRLKLHVPMLHSKSCSTTHALASHTLSKLSIIHHSWTHPMSQLNSNHNLKSYFNWMLVALQLSSTYP